ncbi:MAG: hypothetical protein ACE5JS_02635 [Nitrospinota bacterium]
MRKRWAPVVVGILGILMAGCGESKSDVQTTGKTVKQIKPEAAEGTGDYRLVEMPAAARRNVVVADPTARDTLSYYESLRQNSR